MKDEFKANIIASAGYMYVILIMKALLLLFILLIKEPDLLDMIIKILDSVSKLIDRL